MYVITRRQPYGYGRPKIRYSREAWMKVKDPLPLKKGREAQGYSQRDLAALCRCTQAAISALETGDMKSCSDDLARTSCRWIKRDLEEVSVAPAPSSVPRMTTVTRGSRPSRAAAMGQARVAAAASDERSVLDVVLVTVGAVLVRHPALGLPQHTNANPWGVHPGDVSREVGGVWPPARLSRPTLARFFGVLADDFREVEADLPTGLDVLDVEASLRLVDGDGPASVVRFVASRVLQDIGLAFPLAVPPDVVALLDAHKRPPRDCVRVLCQLTRLYCSPLDRLDVGPEGRELLLESVGLLVSTLRATASRMPLPPGDHTEQPSDADTYPASPVHAGNLPRAQSGADR